MPKAELAKSAAGWKLSAAQLAGIGPVTASALVATIGDFTQSKNGAQFGSWLGLVPR